MNLYGCVGMQGHSGNQKEEKKRVKRSRRTCFGTRGHGGKTRKGDRDGWGDQRGSWEGKKWKQGVFRTKLTWMHNGEKKKTNTGPKKAKQST